MDKGRYLEGGKVVNTHGVRGEVKLQSWMDRPEVLAGLKTLYLRGKPMTVTGARVQKGCVIAKLAGVDDVNGAMALKNETVYVDRTQVPLPPGAFFLADLTGARVVTEDGAELGTLTEVLELPGQNVYVVQGEREHMIPAVPEFVRHTDTEAGVVTVRLIEGM